VKKALSAKIIKERPGFRFPVSVSVQDISVEGILFGKSLGESQCYFKQWLKARKN